MNIAPRVSIIIPTYNRASLLLRSILSVLAQTYTDFELIVVDDASSDNTEEVVRKLEDQRIHYIRHEINRGGSVARNTGIKAARGQFIAFQDSDDEWFVGKLTKQVQVLENSGEEVGAVYSGMLRWDGSEAVYVPTAATKVKEGDISTQILQRSFIGTPTLLIRKTCLDQIGGGFDEELPRFQDWEMVIRLALITQFRLIDEPLVVAHETPGSITGNKSATIGARERILEKHADTLEQFPYILAGHYCDLGHLHCLYRSTSVGRSWFWRALVLRPMNLKAWIGLGLSLFGSGIYKQGLLALGRNVHD